MNEARILLFIMAYIYKLVFKGTDKLYVGQTRRGLKERLRGHMRSADKPEDNRAVTHAVRKYGRPNIVLLEEIPLEEVSACERKWIQELGTLTPNGYNLTDGGEQGFIVSEETKRRMSVSGRAAKAKPESVEKRRRLSQDPEYRRKLSEGVKRSWSDPAVKERHRKALNSEVRERMSESIKKAWLDPELRKRHSEAMREVYSDPEARKRHGASIKKAMADPAVRKKVSDRVKEALKDPVKRERHRNAQKDPEVKERHRKAVKEALARPEVKRKQSEGIKRALADPDVKRRQREGVKESWRRRKAKLQSQHAGTHALEEEVEPTAAVEA